MELDSRALVLWEETCSDPLLKDTYEQWLIWGWLLVFFKPVSWGHSFFPLDFEGWWWSLSSFSPPFPSTSPFPQKGHCMHMAVRIGNYETQVPRWLIGFVFLPLSLDHWPVILRDGYFQQTVEKKLQQVSLIKILYPTCMRNWFKFIKSSHFPTDK